MSLSHFAVKIQENLSGKTISSYKSGHSCSVNSFIVLAVANTDIEANLKSFLYKNRPKLN